MKSFHWRIIIILILCLLVRVIFLKLAPDPHTLESFVGKKISLQALVIRDPAIRSSGQRVVIVPQGILQKKYPHRLLVDLPLYPRVVYGDLLETTVTLAQVENYEPDPNEAGRPFDYISYLALDDIFYTAKAQTFLILDQGQGNSLYSALFALRRAFLKKADELFPQPHSALVGGLLIGAKQSLGVALEADFRRVGLIHIVVLSGFNVTIIASVIISFLSFLPRTGAFVAGSIAIIFFTIMTGASATVVRSAIMAIIALLAKQVQRDYNVPLALLVAALLMMLYDPRVVIHDPSFQLSFLSTVGLIALSPLVVNRLWRVPERFQLREIVTATLSTQLFVLPYLLYSMGDFSVVALVVNLLVLPFIPITMLLSFVAVVAGFVNQTLGIFSMVPAYFFLQYELLVVKFFSHLPFASFSVGFFPGWLTALCYSVYAVVLGRIHLKIYER